MTEKAPRKSPLAMRMKAAIDKTRSLADEHSREDLAARLTESEARLDDPSLHVLVVGEFKQGKSSLVNALVGRAVCPVDDDIATAVPTVLRHAPDPQAAVLYQPPEPTDPAEPPGDPIRESVPIDSVAAFVTEEVKPEGDRSVHSVELAMPAEVLEAGLVLVDTPGVGGLGSIHSTVTLGALPMAEALIFVSDASQEFTEPEIEFMESARSMCPNIVVLLTKTDFYPAWRKVKALNEAHLERLEIPAEIMPVSSTLHTAAVELGDDALDEESGFPAMRKHLMSRIVGRAEELSAVKLRSDLLGVLDQIQGALKTKRQALRNPEEVQAKREELKAAKEQANELKSRAARWQQTLGDGTADLNAEVDHDLRARFRKINQQVDDVLDDIDPATAWDEFEPWLYQRVAEDVVNNYKFLQIQARQLAETVSEHFAMDSTDLAALDLEVSDPTEGLNRADVEASFEAKQQGGFDKYFGTIRGGVMGSFILSAGVGMVLPFAGVAAAAVAPAIAVFFGVKHVKDEKGRAITQRRTQARTAQRKYMDEAQFLANKDARAAARLTQRELRNFFTTRANEQARSVEEHLTALNAAVQADQRSIKQELAKVDTQMQALNKARNQVGLIAPDPAAA